MSGRSFALLMWFGIAGVTSAVAQGPDPTLRALELYRHGNCKEAEPLLEQVLQTQPKNVAVRKLYASCLTQTGRFEQAKAQYRAILAAAPKDRDAQEALRPRAVRVETSSAGSAPVAAPTPRPPQYPPDFARAEVLIRDKRLPEAERLLEQMLAHSPQAVLPRQRLAEIYTATNRFELAAGAYRVLAAANPTRSMFQLRAAQNLAWAKQYDGAAGEYRTYLEGSPRDADARLALANVLMWSGQLSDAANEYREYLEARPEDANSRISLANVLLWMKRYADAALEFKTAIAAIPSESRAHAGLAQCYERMGQPQLAVEAYDRALQADPANAEIKGAKTRLLAELPRQKAFVAMERQENLEAAQHFLEYLQQHPESDETVLQIARLYAWGKKYSESITFYNQYLGRKPEDRVALRELARTELSAADFGNARQHYALLIRGEDAGTADYEGLIHAFVWDGKLEEAHQTAQKLAEIEPRNEVALKATREYRDSKNALLIAEARDLTASRRYTDAIQRYREYQQVYGVSAEAELAIARLYSWDKKYSEAESAYHNYLLKHPADTEARLEMGNVQRWMGHYDLALRSYNGVLSADPRNPTALLGIAQVADNRGADAFTLLRSYRQVLAADPKEQTAANRLEELIPQTSASMGYGFRSFGDSDGFYRAENRFETSFPFTGHLRLSPYYALDYFHQYRQVGGVSCATENPKLDDRARALSSEICGRNGTYWGSGGGIRTQLGSALGTNLVLDLGVLRFSGRTYANVRGDLNVHLSAGSMMFLQVVRRPAVFDVNTVAAVGAGIMGDTAVAGFQTSLGDRWRLWAAGGFTRYSSGIERLYGNNMQRRFSVKLDYAVLPTLRAGYVVRVSTFDKSSPYYFSPSRYLTYGLSYNWMQPLARHVRLELDGEGGLGQIKRFGVARLNTLELAVQPAIVWSIYPGLDFRFGYRYSRGRSSSFGSPVYSAGGADFGLVRSLAERYVAPDPARLDIR